jgi:hypothetical protein
VEVVVEDYVGGEAESFVVAAVGEGFGDDFEIWGAGEYREPFEGGQGDEIDAFGVDDAVA